LSMRARMMAFGRRRTSSITTAGSFSGSDII
jgi:hypothetical protein